MVCFWEYPNLIGIILIMCVQMSLIVDVANHRGQHGEDVIKELALVGDRNGSYSIQSYTFKPPYPSWTLTSNTRQTNRYSTRYLHGIEWSEGELPYHRSYEIVKEVFQKHTFVYTKGEEKARFLTNMSGILVEDLGGMGCPKADDLQLTYPLVCGFGHKKHCALTKAVKYMNWLQNTFE